MRNWCAYVRAWTGRTVVTMLGGWIVLAGAPAWAEGLRGGLFGRGTPCPPPPCLTPATPQCTTPGMPWVPGTPSTTPPTTTTTPTTPPVMPEQPVSAPAGGFGDLTASAVGGNYFSGSAYIDSALPISQFRLRFDSAYNNNRPDRGEFFYPKCGCLGNPANRQGLSALGLFDPNAPGPRDPRGERSVDYQELRSYLEVAVSERLSGFLEVPTRWINPDFNDNTSGLGDIQFGFKYAAVYTPDTVFSFQLRTNAPSGDPDRGLGTNNWAVEPALLLYHRFSDRLFLDAEIRDYVPIGGTDFAGNVLRYGVGLSYLVVNRPNFRVAPVTELVGWTLLSGKETVPDARVVADATGDTIINAKFGVRFGFGQSPEAGVMDKVDVYIGYGRALTGEVWYKDLLRLELRYRF